MVLTPQTRHRPGLVRVTVMLIERCRSVLTGRCGGEHLRRRVHRGDVRRVAEQLAGPHAGTAGKLKHTAARPERPKGFGYLAAPRKLEGMVPILRSECPVVGDLLTEKLVEFFVAR
jgi:hypothetical protein